MLPVPSLTGKNLLHRIGRLHLVHHQISYGAFILRVNAVLPPPVRDEVGRREVVEEVESVNYSDQGVQFDDTLQTSKLCSKFIPSVCVR